MNEQRDYAVEVVGAGKHYGSVQALDGVNFAVERGEVFGLAPTGRARPPSSASWPPC